MKNKSKDNNIHICDSNCIYYPLYPLKVLKEYIDEFGISHRVSVYLCKFDSHRIIKYDLCKNYKNRQMLKRG